MIALTNHALLPAHSMNKQLEQTIEQFQTKRLRWWSMLSSGTVLLLVSTIIVLEIHARWHHAQIVADHALIKQEHTALSQQWHKLQVLHKQKKLLEHDLSLITQKNRLGVLLKTISLCILPTIIVHKIKYTQTLTEVSGYADSIYNLAYFIKKLSQEKQIVTLTHTEHIPAGVLFMLNIHV